MRVLVNPETDKDLIIYNHLFSRDTDYKFTTDALQKDLEQYKLVLTLNEVQDIINWYIEKGLVYQHFRHYSTKGYS